VTGVHRRAPRISRLRGMYTEEAVKGRRVGDGRWAMAILHTTYCYLIPPPGFRLFFLLL
jgi:hypothetical protein